METFFFGFFLSNLDFSKKTFCNVENPANCNKLLIQNFLTFWGIVVVLC